jgi:GNAT superfamily N-acetyltransferase
MARSIKRGCPRRRLAILTAYGFGDEIAKAFLFVDLAAPRWKFVRDSIDAFLTPHGFWYSSIMEIRTMTAGDMNLLGEIDATVESSQYLHIDRAGEGIEIGFKMQARELREKRIHRLALDVDQIFTIRQIVEGTEEGIALVAEHDGQLVGAATAKVDETAGILGMIDLRVDFDFRRQGLASAMMFQIIQNAGERKLRAVIAQTTADFFPGISLLSKLGFELTGLDTNHKSNHDLVKETVTLFWYLVMD